LKSSRFNSIFQNPFSTVFPFCQKLSNIHLFALNKLSPGRQFGIAGSEHSTPCGRKGDVLNQTTQQFNSQNRLEVSNMHRHLQLSLFVILCIAGVAFLATREAAARPDDSNAFVGTWDGSWSGGGNGKFGMTISKGAAGKLSGSISPTPDSGDGYTATFKSVEVTAGKLTAKFEDPNGESDITLTGSAEGKSAKGTYSVRLKGDGTEADSGSWTATRK
jgi:hypothetical protein